MREWKDGVVAPANNNDAIRSGGVWIQGKQKKKNYFVDNIELTFAGVCQGKQLNGPDKNHSAMAMDEWTGIGKSATFLP